MTPVLPLATAILLLTACSITLAAERLRFWNLTTTTITELYLAPAGRAASARNRLGALIRLGTLRSAVLAVAAVVASASSHAEPAPLAMTEIAAGVFVHNGVHEEASSGNDDAIANIGFIIGADGVAVIDPGGSFEEGSALRAAIRARTDRPTRYVILTHVHPDHIFGAAAFSDDHPDFVGHAKLPGALAQRGDYYLRRLRGALGEGARGSEVVPPTVLVSDTLDLDLGGRRLILRAHGPAHTDNDLAVFDENTRTFWLADLLFVDRIPVIDGSLVGWLKELDELAAIPADRAVPGHGPVSVPWPEAAAPERRYLETVVRDTRAAIKAGIGIADAYRDVAMSEHGRWLFFDDYHPRNVTASYKELEWE